MWSLAKYRSFVAVHTASPRRRRYVSVVGRFPVLSRVLTQGVAEKQTRYTGAVSFFCRIQLQMRLRSNISARCSCTLIVNDNNINNGDNFN